MTTLRLFNPDDSGNSRTVSAFWSVRDFVELWYLPALLADPTRRPPSEKTINKRRVAAAWWSDLMGTTKRPDGPALGDITTDDLALFRGRLATAFYRRGKLGERRALSPFSQFRQCEELQTILNAAGPRLGRRVRAGVLPEVPAIFLESPTVWPKDCWTIDEAKRIFAALSSFSKIGRLKIPAEKYRQFATASLAFWFYTGHRASTIFHIKKEGLVQVRPGQWFLFIDHSVKTRKRDRVAVHPALLDALRPLWSAALPSGPLISWPILYRGLFDHHADWQTAAGLDPGRTFGPQAWRRLHAAAIAQSGYQSARDLAAGSLGHSSVSITETFYASIRDAAVLSLPDLRTV